MSSFPSLSPNMTLLKEQALAKGIKKRKDKVAGTSEAITHYRGMVLVQDAPFLWLCIGHKASVFNGVQNAKGYTLRDGYIEYIPILVQPRMYTVLKRWVARVQSSQTQSELIGKDEERFLKAIQSLDGISLLELSLIPHLFPRFDASIVAIRSLAAELCQDIDETEIQKMVSLPLLDLLNGESKEHGILSHFSWTEGVQVRDYEGITLIQKHDPLYFLAWGHEAASWFTGTLNFSDNGFVEYDPFFVQRASGSRVRQWAWSTLEKTIYELYKPEEAKRRWEYIVPLLQKQPPVFFYVFYRLQRRLLHDKTKIEYIIEATLMLLAGRPLRDYPAQLL